MVSNKNASHNEVDNYCRCCCCCCWLIWSFYMVIILMTKYKQHIVKSKKLIQSETWDTQQKLHIITFKVSNAVAVVILKTSDINAVDDGLLPPALQWRRATPGVDEHESHHRDDERQPADHHHGHADVSQSSPEGLAGVSEQVLLAHAAVRLVFLHTRRAPFPLTQLRQPEDKTRVASASKPLVARWQTGVWFITVLTGVKQATGNLMANSGSVYTGFSWCKTATL